MICHLMQSRDYCPQNSSLPWAMNGSDTKTLLGRHPLSWRMTQSFKSCRRESDGGMSKKDAQKVGAAEADRLADWKDVRRSFAIYSIPMLDDAYLIAVNIIFLLPWSEHVSGLKIFHVIQ